MPYDDIIQQQITIAAPASRIWNTLTEPALIREWMLDTPLEILTEWRQGGEVLIRGDLHGLAFENRGRIARFEAPSVLEYTHWSTLSILADVPEHYSVLRFEILSLGDEARLGLTISNLITYEIHKHLAFYWNSTLALIKQTAERDNGK